ncbi:exported hypothetical protein [Verrucomicrobia bacterium]|nr:exported hypothetical protein [Verrucomicrobiota bacterium]
MLAITYNQAAAAAATVMLYLPVSRRSQGMAGTRLRDEQHECFELCPALDKSRKSAT